MVDLNTYVACGVLALEGGDLYVLYIHDGGLGLLGTDAEECGRHLGQCAETYLEVHLIALDHVLEIGSEGLAVEGRHENRLGTALGVSHHVVGTLAQEGKHTTVEHSLLHLLTIE